MSTSSGSPGIPIVLLIDTAKELYDDQTCPWHLIVNTYIQPLIQDIQRKHEALNGPSAPQLATIAMSDQKNQILGMSDFAPADLVLQELSLFPQNYYLGATSAPQKKSNMSVCCAILGAIELIDSWAIRGVSSASSSSRRQSAAVLPVSRAPSHIILISYSKPNQYKEAVFRRSNFPDIQWHMPSRRLTSYTWDSFPAELHDRRSTFHTISIGGAMPTRLHRLHGAVGANIIGSCLKKLLRNHQFYHSEYMAPLPSGSTATARMGVGAPGAAYSSAPQKRSYVADENATDGPSTKKARAGSSGSSSGDSVMSIAKSQRAAQISSPSAFSLYQGHPTSMSPGSSLPLHIETRNSQRLHTPPAQDISPHSSTNASMPPRNGAVVGLRRFSVPHHDPALWCGRVVWSIPLEKWDADLHGVSSVGMLSSGHLPSNLTLHLPPDLHITHLGPSNPRVHLQKLVESNAVPWSGFVSLGRADMQGHPKARLNPKCALGHYCNHMITSNRIGYMPIRFPGVARNTGLVLLPFEPDDQQPANLVGLLFQNDDMPGFGDSTLVPSPWTVAESLATWARARTPAPASIATPSAGLASPLWETRASAASPQSLSPVSDGTSSYRQQQRSQTSALLQPPQALSNYARQVSLTAPHGNTRAKSPKGADPQLLNPNAYISPVQSDRSSMPAWSPHAQSDSCIGDAGSPCEDMSSSDYTAFSPYPARPVAGKGKEKEARTSVGPIGPKVTTALPYHPYAAMPLAVSPSSPSSHERRRRQAERVVHYVPSVSGRRRPSLDLLGSASISPGSSAAPSPSRMHQYSPCAPSPLANALQSFEEEHAPEDHLNGSAACDLQRLPDSTESGEIGGMAGMSASLQGVEAAHFTPAPTPPAGPRQPASSLSVPSPRSPWAPSQSPHYFHAERATEARRVASSTTRAQPHQLHQPTPCGSNLGSSTSNLLATHTTLSPSHANPSFTGASHSDASFIPSSPLHIDPPMLPLEHEISRADSAMPSTTQPHATPPAASSAVSCTAESLEQTALVVPMLLVRAPTLEGASLTRSEPLAESKTEAPGQAFEQSLVTGAGSFDAAVHPAHGPDIVTCMSGSQGEGAAPWSMASSSEIQDPSGLGGMGPSDHIGSEEFYKDARSGDEPMTGEECEDILSELFGESYSSYMYNGNFLGSQTSQPEEGTTEHAGMIEAQETPWHSHLALPGTAYRSPRSPGNDTNQSEGAAAAVTHGNKKLIAPNPAHLQKPAELGGSPASTFRIPTPVSNAMLSVSLPASPFHESGPSSSN
ncbi:hypothetical protein BOTBODRAFT_175470 [Botryobasidium botryosum FD-172 SS1]|uniref:Uncharacterized protein n=1 Tax=Botryobasidium botryosum (strain FD-172 SS1) TaxID=930990 RepID=A0A067MCH3_BOTB1|nr:hypothetical protein BOTBODRAFT_175470 [Botryobasidium botryosum FD-172 SS1]